MNVTNKMMVDVLIENYNLNRGKNMDTPNLIKYFWRIQFHNNKYIRCKICNGIIEQNNLYIIW